MEGLLSPVLLGLTLLLVIVVPSSLACNASCQLPDCACPTTAIPAGLEKVEIPQMVLVMFDGRLGEGAEKIVRRLFPSDRRNPNKCPIVSTFFVSNENTDYCAVNRLWAEGHEIGVNGVARHTQDFWQEATAADWDDEIGRQEENLQEKAGISPYAQEGWRTPHLQPGGDKQFQTLALGYYFLYDSTLQVPLTKNSNNETETYWPFTLDQPYLDHFPYCYRCPERSHPKMWELPVTPLWDKQGKLPCAYLNACPTLRDNPVETYNLLHQNFDHHFKGNRTPFMVNVVPRWLMDNEEAAKGLENFILDMVKKEEVWVISGSQAIQWARDPRTLGQLDSFAPWGCHARRYKTGCLTGSSSFNKTVKLFPGLFGGGASTLLLWQYVILTITLIVLVQYDRRRK